MSDRTPGGRLLPDLGARVLKCPSCGGPARRSYSAATMLALTADLRSTFDHCSVGPWGWYCEQGSAHTFRASATWDDPEGEAILADWRAAQPAAEPAVPASWRFVDASEIINPKITLPFRGKMATFRTNEVARGALWLALLTLEDPRIDALFTAAGIIVIDADGVQVWP